MSIVFPMFLLTVAAAIGIFLHENHRATSMLMARSAQLAEVTRASAQERLWRYDRDELQSIVDTLTGNEHILGAKIEGLRPDSANAFKVQAGTIIEGADLGEDVIRILTPLTYLQNGEVVPIGKMVLFASQSQVLAETRRQMIVPVIMATSTMLLASIFILLLLRRRVTLPLMELEKALHAGGKKGGGSSNAQDFSFDFSLKSENVMVAELRSVTEAITWMRSVALKSKSELEGSQKQVLRAAEVAGLGYGTINLAGSRFYQCNDNLAAMMGTTAAEVLDGRFDAKGFFERLLDQTDVKREERRTILERGETLSETFKVVLGKGEHRYFRAIMEPFTEDSDHGVCLELVAQDVTEIRRAEERVRQAEKMQTIGKLTGGVAHDFNNILAIISGNLELLGELSDDPETKPFVASGLMAVGRGARLTQQLLAFARKQPLSPIKLDLARLVSGMQSMFEISGGPNVEVEIVTEKDLWATTADPNQLEACVLNLVVNARDAMPEGGKLTIEVSNAVIDRDYARAHSEVIPGQYVCVTIKDTGVGMPPEVAAKAFEPFFTTKGVGKGTGLGLSMAFGFAKQTGGHVSISSQEGRGSSVKMYLPRSLGDVSAPCPKELVAAVSDVLQRKRVLLIEDEQELLELYGSQLGALGCRVDKANSGERAMALVGQIEKPDVILTDMILAGSLNGKQTADLLVQDYPGTPIVFMSGFTENAIIQKGKLSATNVMLQKPFTLHDLARTLEDVFD